MSSPSQGAPTVLIVDDDRGLVEALARWLEEDGYHVERAFDGRQGLAVMDAHAPDVIVADVLMPGIDGIELAERVRVQGVPVVLMSGIEPPRPVPEGVVLVSKPFDGEEIVRAIDAAIGDDGAPGTEQAPPRETSGG